MPRKKNVSLKRLARLFVGVVFLLCILGVFWVFEASIAESYQLLGDPYHFVKQHVLGVGVGLCAFVVAALLPTRVWLTLGNYAWVGGLLLLLLVFVPGIGVELNGAKRWIALGGVVFQPVELYKLSLIIFLASWLTKHQRLGPFLLSLSVSIVIIILQPDLGSLLMVLGIACGMYFLAGGKLLHFVGVGAVLLAVVAGLIATSPYRMERVRTFFNPESNPSDSSFHIRQITIALGRGGWVGQGVGNSKQRFSYIPEASTDSIFAIIAEEVGFLGSILMMLLLFSYTILGFRIASAHDEPAVQLLGYGIVLWVGMQMILNLSAIVALVPLTGIPLPFISYGRSALVMVLFSSGIILRIASES
ncbi:MAG: cell division protein FtsW [Pseudomonadales bacterium]|nr:cell division protein FtsW [Candidatus Woesebacteria bacterium]MCB9802128.1 cell division protein FtsW [Pseudomonadales bacterium]